MSAGIGRDDRVLKEWFLFRLVAASNIAARSGKELERRLLLLNEEAVSGKPLSSGCVLSLRTPNCFRNHFFVIKMGGGLKFPTFSVSFSDFKLV